VKLHVSCIAIVALAAASMAAAQTFKSGADLVRFDVRVVDGSGRSITDLRPDEIEIYESGKRLPVVLFQRVTEPAESYVDAAVRAVTAEVSSNEAFPRGHLYILLFDQEHITPGNEQKARMAAEQFIRRRVRPSDRVALFAIPGPGPQIGFTTDRTRVIKELESIRGSHERLVTSPVGQMTAFEAHRVVQGDERLIVDLTARLAEGLGSDVTIGGSGQVAGRAAGGAVEDSSTVRRVLAENARTIVNQTDAQSRQFLQRLADIVAGFRDIDGRKTVVLFSEGFYQDNLSRELEAVAAAAAQSYCVFYTLDLNQRTNALDQAQVSDTVLGSEIQARIAPMATLAVETDGLMVVDAANRVGSALDTIAAQTQEYYLVGFVPSEEARLHRGQYRRVEIKVKRSGATVSARTGYTVAPESAVASRRRAIDNVLGAPFVSQGLKIDYTTYVMKAPEPGKHRVVLSLTADLPVRSQETDAADVVFVARDVRDGRVVASGTDTIPLPAQAEAGAPLGSGNWRVQFSVPAGTYLMRTVVREPGGLTGSADRRIMVRPLDGPDVTVSDLVVGSAVAGLPVHARAYTGDGMSGLLEVYGRTLVQLQDLSVRVELRKPGENATVTALSADLLDPEEDEVGISRRASFVLGLDNVPPGDYIAHAIVTARGETVAERTRQVEVLEGVAPAAAASPVGRDVRPANAGPDVNSAKTISPVQVLRGNLARTYVASIRTTAKGTPYAETARRAAEGRWEEVEADLKRTAEDSGEVASALRGFALFAREDYAGAAAALARAQDAAPKNALTAFFLGWAREGAGDARGAISAWRSAAYLDPSMVSAHLALCDGYLRIAQPALALQALRAGLKMVPESVELQTRLQQVGGK
jgi:VWFA-related protein